MISIGPSYLWSGSRCEDLLHAENVSSSYAFSDWRHLHKRGLGPTVRGTEAETLSTAEMGQSPL